MIDQLDIFDQISTAETRHEAERSIKPSAAAYREQVYRCIAENGPLTDERIADLTKMNPSTSRPRRLELVRAGRIEAAGYSKTRAGRKAVAWRVAS